MPKISLITVVYNNAQTIGATLRSVEQQTYSNREYIVIDGGSTDGTLRILQDSSVIDVLVSEPDLGTYDALNKGIAAATGDIVGLIHSDDEFASSEILTSVAKAFQEDIDSVIGDIVFVNQSDKVIRWYRAANFEPRDFARGMMPPHPSFYARRDLFSKYGNYDLRYRIAADFELMMRFLLIHKVGFRYLPLTMVRMRPGGASTRGLMSNITINREIRDACKRHKVPTSYLRIYSKYFAKIWQFISPRLTRGTNH